MIKNEHEEQIDISEISDPSMQLKILAEQLRNKITDISKEAGFNNNVYNGRHSISSDRLAVLDQKFDDAEYLQKVSKNVSLDDKLKLLDCVKMRQQDKIMGIDPIDFNIYKQLGIFDSDGNHNNIFAKDKQVDHEQDEEQQKKMA